MKTIKSKSGKEVIVYATTFEDEAMKQVVEIANSEMYCEEKIRIMPDAHAGKGCTVGTTMTIRDKVTPNLVGVDIGCGMLTVRFACVELNLEEIDKIIKAKVPCGFNVHSYAVSEFNLSKLICKDNVDISRAKLSIGSLGGGNHFIEISRSEKDGSFYLIIHTGSRKLGGDVCKHYQEIAVDNCAGLGMSKDLAYLSGLEMECYMKDMKLVQEFAIANRKAIADIIIRESGLIEIEIFETIHNYIDFSRMILRKGAVSSEIGEKLLIPINMRDGSLLCIGKGNADWNYSAPHGAGRLMSRTKAKKELSMKLFDDSMSGIYTTSVSSSTLDEAPMAYKSIDEIVSAIGDTAEVVDILKPIYNFKAH